MRRLAWALCLAMPLAHAAPETLRIDPKHTFVTFEVRHFGTSTLRGRFGPIEGHVELDRAAGRGRVGLAIATAGVDTGVKPLDARLCESDLLACRDHPQAFFVAERFRFDADGRVVEVRGELTLRGVSSPLSLRAQRFGCYRNPLVKREVCGGDFEAELLRSEFGASFGIPFVGDRVKLKVQVEALRD